MATKWSGEDTGFKCPFTARPLKLCQLGTSDNWVAVSEGVGGGWVSSAVRGRDALVRMLHAQSWSVRAGEPRSEADLKCPVFGTEFRINEVEGRGWTASSSNAKFGYSTTPFWSRRHLEYFLSTRAGVPPVFSNGDVKVRDRTPPPPPVGDIEEAKSRQEAVYAAVDEVVDRSGVESGVVKPRVMVGPGSKRR